MNPFQSLNKASVKKSKRKDNVFLPTETICNQYYTKFGHRILLFVTCGNHLIPLQYHIVHNSEIIHIDYETMLRELKSMYESKHFREVHYCGTSAVHYWKVLTNCVHSFDSILPSWGKRKKITFLVPHGTAILRNIRVPTCKNVDKTAKCVG